MGDRGIHLDPHGKVRSESLEDEKIIAPKPWKACKSPVPQRSYTWDDESLFTEAGQEIQNILFQSYSLAYQKTGLVDPPNPIQTPYNNGNNDSDNTNNTNDDDFNEELSSVVSSMEMHFPVFSASPGNLSTTPITPPTRSHNPIVFNSSFTSDNDRVPDGAELGLLSISPPPTAKLF
jgi:hypothetical protein